MLGHDLRYAFRTLVRNPGFTFVSVLALALGIGANSAIFTVVNSVLLEPLHFYKPHQLAQITDRNLGLGFPQFSVSPGNYLAYRDQNHSFSGIAAVTNGNMNYAASDQPERLSAMSVTTNFFDVLHTQPMLGRAFTKQESELGFQHVVVLSYGLWRRRFGGSGDALGQRMNLNGEMYDVVGVMPQGFEFLSPTNELWRPLALKQEEWQQHGGHYLHCVGRLKDGVTLQAAAMDLNIITTHLQETYPGSNHGWDTTLMDLQDAAVGKIRPAMLTLLAAVGFVLLIACVNLANLLLSRSAGRKKEIGIRGALGAGKFRLIRQLLTESLLLSAIGTALGLAVAWAGAHALVSVNPRILPRATEITLDWRAVAFTAAVGILTGILFGLAPALQMARSDLQSALREGGRGNSVGFQRNSLRSVLVTGEVALALVLLSGAGLLMRSFYRLQSVDPGFDSHGVLTFRANLPIAKYPTDPQQAAFYERALENVRALPGVTSAGAANIFPLAGGDEYLNLVLLGRPPKPPGQGDSAMYYTVAPGYFETMRIPLKAGRYFSNADTTNSPKVAIVSEEMARKFYPNQNPIGQRISMGGGKPSEIIGIAGDVRHDNLESQVPVAVYETESQSTDESMYFCVRTAGSPEALISGIRATIRNIDAELPIDAIGTVDTLLETSLSQRRFTMLLMAIFAGLAMALAMVGIYGVLSYSVTQATQEIGIRLALGAQPGDIMQLVLRYGGLLIGVGVLVGVGAAMLTGRLLASQLFEVRATDPATYAAVAGALALTGFVACLIPAWRAMRVDPIIALRNE